jgi:hypothetical protein
VERGQYRQRAEQRPRRVDLGPGHG